RAAHALAVRAGAVVAYFAEVHMPVATQLDRAQVRAAVAVDVVAVVALLVGVDVGVAAPDRVRDADRLRGGAVRAGRTQHAGRLALRGRVRGARGDRRRERAETQEAEFLGNRVHC